MNMIDQSLMDTMSFYASFAALGIGAVGVLIFIGHLLKLMITTDLKSKYDYINMYEINRLWYSSLLIIIALAVYINGLETSLEIVWLAVKLFISVMFAIIAGVVIQNVLKFYYPFYIEKRLKKLRYSPRISPDGKKMRLLSEEEEDVYLDEGMQAEEDAFSIDYDVWLEEESGFTQIEKYNGRLHALNCTECNYQTLKVTTEEVLKSPSIEEEGELSKHFTCGYCGHKERKTFAISKLRDPSATTPTST